jgi:hypothetical protein
MAQIGNEVVERPPPGKPANEPTVIELEADEQVKIFILYKKRADAL